MQVVSMTVSGMLNELRWMPCESPDCHTPLIETPEDVRKLELLMDVLDTLTRIMDTRIAYLNTDGKLIREWVEKILEIGDRYGRELQVLDKLEKDRKSR